MQGVQVCVTSKLSYKLNITKVGENMTSELRTMLKEVRLQTHITENFKLVSFDNHTVVLKWLHSGIQLLLECEPIPINPINTLSLMRSNKYDVNFEVALRFRNFRTTEIITNNSDSIMLHKAMLPLDGKTACALCFGNFEFNIVL